MQESPIQPSREQLPEIQILATAVPSTQENFAQEQVGVRDVVHPKSTNPIREQTNEAQQDDPWRPQQEDDDVPSIQDPIDFLEAARLSHIRIAQSQAESNKENLGVPHSQTESRPRNVQKPSLMDRQPNAVRVEFDEISVLSQSSQASQASEDAGFQSQVAPTHTTARRALKPSSNHPPAQPTRPRFSPARISRIQESNRSDRLDVSSHIPVSQPAPSQLENYKEANSVAKNIKALSTKPQKVQTRRPWSDRETEQLLTLIEEYGTSYSMLHRRDQERGNILQERDQIALKDKARNMKVDYLKYVFLPLDIRFGN